MRTSHNSKNKTPPLGFPRCVEHSGCVIRNHTSELVCALNVNGVITYASPSYKRILGYSPHELLGQSGFSLIHPDDKAFVEATFKERLNHDHQGRNVRKESYYEYRVKERQGAYHYFQTTVNLVDDQTVWISRDVTSEKQLQDDLKASEIKYRTLVENSREVIAVINWEGVFLFINKIGAQYLGGRPEKFMGKTQWDIFPKEVADQRMGLIRQVIKSQTSLSSLCLTPIQGVTRWNDITVEPIETYEGDSRCAMMVSRDIHDFKRTQEELQQYREEMIRAEHLASLGTLSAMLAHELNQPLTVIRLAMENIQAQHKEELLQDKGRSLAKERSRKIHDQSDALSDCIRGVELMTEIISRFRTFARRSSDQPVQVIDMGKVARDALMLVQHSAERVGLKIRLKDMDRLPPVASNIRDMNQLFFALIENSIQAAKRKQGCRLWIEGKIVDSAVEVCFRDTCGGVEQENLDHIFQPFFTTKPQGEGTGLGLCTVSRIVEKTGGTLQVENKTGYGIIFRICLPMKRD